MGCLKLTHNQQPELRVVHVKKAVTSSDWVKRVRSSYFFGMLMPGRHDEINGNPYTYGFNGMERDEEIKGAGNSYDFGARMQDPRLGRWLSIDPLAAKYPAFSPYSFVANNPINLVDPDGREIIPSDAFKNNTKVSAIFRKLSKTDILSNITKNFMGERPVVHLMLDVKSLGASPNAYTSPPNLSGNPHAVGITFNSDYIDKASDISVARTFLHESIHAEMFRKIESGDGTVNINDFPGIFDYYSRYGSDGDWQHNQMAEHYVNTISDGLKQFDKENGITDRSGSVTIDGKEVNYSSEQFYKGMSYGGLHGTEAWEDLSKSDQKLYSKIISNEANGGGAEKNEEKSAKP